MQRIVNTICEDYFTYDKENKTCININEDRFLQAKSNRNLNAITLNGLHGDFEFKEFAKGLLEGSSKNQKNFNCDINFDDIKNDIMSLIGVIQRIDSYRDLFTTTIEIYNLFSKISTFLKIKFISCTGTVGTAISFFDRISDLFGSLRYQASLVVHVTSNSSKIVSDAKMIKDNFGVVSSKESGKQVGTFLKFLLFWDLE